MLIVDDETFQKEVVESDQPVVVKFGATWCGPCKLMNDVFQEVIDSEKEDVDAGNLPTAVSDFKFVAMDVNESVEIPPTYAVRGIPTTLVIYQGKVVGKPLIGMMQSGQLQEHLDTWSEKIKELNEIKEEVEVEIDVDEED